jgi:Zn-dependent M28 family amino/carboxypeptidase
MAMRAIASNGRPFEMFPQLRGSATLGPAAAAALLAGEAITLDRLLAEADQGRTQSFPLRKHVRIRTTTAIGNAISPNVVGVIRGSDPTRAAEHVVLSAHLDHLGISDRGEDRIRNGSGIAALIEIARQLAAAEVRPARSIVILAVTGEEKGTQGSAAFADRPTVRGPLVANVNMDMLTMLFPLKSLVALGMEHSSLGPLARTAAADAGFTLQPDPQPEEVRFIRSDQFSFVEHGIPAITYKGGLESSDPSIDGDKIGREWLKTIYHSPKDERDQQIDYESGVVHAIANATERPRWNPGDFFGKRFGRERRTKH